MLETKEAKQLTIRERKRAHCIRNFKNSLYYKTIKVTLIILFISFIFSAITNFLADKMITKQNIEMLLTFLKA